MVLRTSSSTFSILHLVSSPIFPWQTFIYRCLLVSGDVKLSATYKDHLWVTEDELQEYLPAALYAAMKRFVAE